MHKNEHYTDSIYYQIELTAKYCRHLGMQTFEKLNMPLNVDEFAALDVIIANDQICQRELAKLILKDRPTTGRILNSLEEKGYVKRFADTKNNRLVRKISVTSKGKDIANKITETLRNYIDKLPKVFSGKDKEILINSIKKFRESLTEVVAMNI